MVERWFVFAKWFGFSDCARTYISVLLINTILPELHLFGLLYIIDL